MNALTPQEMLFAWLLSRLLLIVVPAASCFLVGRRGRLRLWHYGVAVALAALLLLPATALTRVLGRPVVWLPLARRLAGEWPSLLIALSIGCGLGRWLPLSGRRRGVAEG